VTAERTPIAIDDLYQLGWLEDPRVSPDGRHAAYVHVTVDRAANRYRRAIWLAPLGGGAPRRFTAGGRSDTQPRWSPNGRWLAFVSDRDGDQPQLYLIRADGGEARRLTSLPRGASDPAWSPDGRRIAFLSRLSAAERAREDSGEPEPQLEDELERRHARERRARDEERLADPRVVSRLPYRSGVSYYDGRFSQIYLLDLPPGDDDEPAAPRRLTDADLHFGAPCWAADGGALLSTAARDPERDTLLGFDDLVRVPAPPEGRGAFERVTGPGYSYAAPQVSPDGRHVAVMRRPDDRPLFSGWHLALVPLDGGEQIDLSSGADRNVESFAWLPDGSGLAFVAGWRGEAPVYVTPAAAGQPTADDRSKTDDGPASTANPSVGGRWSVVSGRLEELVPGQGRIVTEFDVTPDGGVVFVAGDGANPCDLFLRRPDGSETWLTAINEPLLARRDAAPFEEILFHAPDGGEVQGWIIRPQGDPPERGWPLAVHIHGGPHVMWGPGFRSMWHELQAGAARGYVVFFCNPRGSEGYGEAWRSAVERAWSSAAADILGGVDAVVARGGIDERRIGVTGGSYGGYMTAWLIGHSRRFACAVAARGVYNLLTQHSTSDVHELIELEFGGFPWELHELLWRESPLAHAHTIETPLLLLHSELDYRVPIAEAEQLFSLLRRRRRTVELVRYPREGHELTRNGEPRHREDHMRRTLEWLDRYCRS
jgi:dipeptidyl aminopeptidase/acylaminoacyl peptidase